MTEYRQIAWEKCDDVFCVELLHTQIEEVGLVEFSEDLKRLIDDEGCRNLVLRLGPKDPQCLYSVFMAKLVNLKRRLIEAGGALKLAEVAPNAYNVFETCRLTGVFDFYPDVETAVAAFAKS